MSTTTNHISAPPTVGRPRDPFIDVLRVGAVVTVVVGHWIMPVLAWRHGTLTAGNSLATPGWWVLTWFAQVMPVFFFAGGAANYHSLVRADDARTWLTGRVRRLVVPVVPLLAVWLVLPSVLRDFGVPPQPVALGAGVVGQLLWFLAVYLLAMAATPLMYSLARRWGLAVPVVLGLGALGVDVLRFDGVPLVGYLNELLVWLAIQQLGIGYAAGQFDRLSRRGAAALGIAGFGGTALLVLCGPYPVSMVGVPGQAVSNMAPATCCLLTLGVGQIGVLLALRERLFGSGRLLRLIGRNCMTVYLWHMPAMVLVAGIAVLGFGYATPAPGSPGWLAVTPLWIAVLAVALVLLVRMFGRFEQPRSAGRAPSAARLGVAVVLASAGLVGVAAYGFAVPLRVLPWVLAVVVGLGLTWPGAGGRTATRLLGTLMDAIFSRTGR
jgi:fucose 4-O-acetylase-like acetyltransferase